MARGWTLGRKIGAGFAGVVGLTVLVGAVSFGGMRLLVADSHRMNAQAANLVAAAQLEALTQAEIADTRAYIFTRDEGFSREAQNWKAARQTRLAAIQAAVKPEGKALLDEVTRTIDEQEAAMKGLLEVLEVQAARAVTLDKLGALLLREEKPRVDAVRQAIRNYSQYEQRLADEERDRLLRTATRANLLVAAIAGASLLLGIGAAVVLTRGLTRDIGSAVQHVQTSSADLQTAANQQAAASKEQAAATNETTTTIKELVATARQIAESAQRVSGVAEQTVQAARNGEQTVRKAQEALDGIKRQVDLVVSHMLELGRKSQHIGGILELINELAEQTNILAINATIEAAGAGDTGKRFAVVADEIRKLADRVGGSTKDIRTLIEEIRTAVNTTVMATEQGTKAVESGARQVGEVAASFTHIVAMVGTTTEVVREIELSTKQQTTAVEQVNVAMANVAQAARETESTSGETLQTASQLAALSSNLTRMIRAAQA